MFSRLTQILLMKPLIITRVLFSTVSVTGCLDVCPEPLEISSPNFHGIIPSNVRPSLKMALYSGAQVVKKRFWCTLVDNLQLMFILLQENKKTFCTVELTTSAVRTYGERLDRSTIYTAM